jgi:RND family efflux transporter MFP subunit
MGEFDEINNPSQKLRTSFTMPKLLKVFTAILMTTTVAVLLSVGAIADDAKKARGERPRTLVQIDKVKVVLFVQTIPIIGRFVAQQAGVVAARAKGTIGKISVNVGDRVEVGSVMAVLIRDRLLWERNLYQAEVSNYKAQMETKIAKIKLLEQELNRLNSLKKSPAFSQARLEDKQQNVIVAKSEFSESQAQLRKAQANLKLRQIDYADGEIKAPYGGVVTQKHTSVGSYVSVGSPVFTLVDDTTLEIEADVPTERITNLKAGIIIDGSIGKQSKIKAYVRAVVPEENPQTRTRAVRFQTIQMDGIKNLAANQSVTLNLPSGAQKNVLSVHKDAVLNRRGSQMVVIVENGKAGFRPVKLGEASGSRFIVQNGLKDGDVVVIRGNERLRPKQAVRYKGMPKPAAQTKTPEQKKVKG